MKFSQLFKEKDEKSISSKHSFFGGKMLETGLRLKGKSWR